MKILIVEDEKQIARFIRNGLKENGFVAEIVDQGDEAVSRIIEEHFDAVVLDLMLPGLNGLSVLRSLRDRSNRVPVLILTARTTVSERIEGLDAGADDYLAKPFSIDELAARLRALVRRNLGETYSLYRVADLALDIASRTACRGTRQIELTSREFSLLECLMRTPDRVLTRTQLCYHVWEYHFAPETNLVDVYIQRLRRKIDDGESKKLIQTVRGAGYRIGEPP